jgi:glycopeptide antibiotics resistance protein
VSGQLLPAVFAILLGLVIGVLLFVPFVAVQYRREGRLSLRQTLLWSAFLVYGLALWTYTLLPLPDPEAIRCVGAQLRPFQFVDDIRTFPHGSLGELRHNPAVMQVALNVLLFAPLGFFLRLIWRRGFVVTTLVGFLVSLAIETTQLTGVWGIYPCGYRLFDVDDLIANTGGALLGGLTSLALRPWLARSGETEAPQPHPVTFARRMVVMLCDALSVVLLGGLAGTAANAWMVYGMGERLPDSALSSAIAGWLPFAVFGLLALVTGGTVGDHAALVRWDGGLRPALLARLLRYLGGVGGWQLLVLLASPADVLFVLASVILLIVTSTRGGLPGILSRAKPVDARLPKPSPAKAG